MLMHAFIPAAGASAQTHFYFGANAGAMLGILDWDTSAIAKYISSIPSYHNYAYEQAEFSISPLGGIIMGYSTRRFAFETGAELLLNVQEATGLKKTVADAAYAAVARYTYSSIIVPLIMRINFAAKPSFRFGMSLGPYFSFPLGEIERTLEGAKIFKAPDALPGAVSYLTQPVFVGARFGLHTEFNAGKKGAIMINVDFHRELTSGVRASMLLDSMLSPNGMASISNREEKISILNGMRVALGYKYRIQLSGAAAHAGAGAEEGVDAAAQAEMREALKNPTRYYMIVGGQTEGPLTVSDLRGLAERGLIDKDSYLWKKGLADWAKADTFEELSILF
jgi:hypothetical protein